MAVKIYLDTDIETKKLYDEKIFRETQKMTFFDKFKSKDGSSIIHQKDQLSKDKGDTIYFYLASKLDDKQVFTQGQTITGNEQKLTSYRDSVTLAESSLAVAFEGGLSEHRPVFSIDDESQRMLKEAGASLSDQQIFDALSTGTPSKIFKLADTPTTTTATVASLTATDMLTPKKVSFLKTGALTGYARSQEPLKPVMVDGKPHLVMIVHPDALYDLKTNPDYVQFMREAEVRGKENPLFTGSVAVIDGVIIHESERIDIGLTGGSSGNVPYAWGWLLGKQAIIEANGKREEIVMETRNYKKITGYCWSIIRGLKRTTFNSKDWSAVKLLMARTRVSD